MYMRVALVRHGAYSTSRRGSLSEEGRREVEAIAHFLKGLIRTDTVYSSPSERCMESASIIAGNEGARIVVSPYLGAEGDIEALQHIELREDAVLVTHLPVIRSIVSSLCSEDTSAALEIGTGALLLLELHGKGEGRHATILFLIQPAGLTQNPFKSLH